MREARDHRRHFTDKVYVVGSRGVQRLVRAGRLHGVSERTCRKLYWETAPLTPAAGPAQTRSRDVDWRERYRAEAASLWATDPERAKGVTRIGWRLFCRQSRIQQLEDALRSLQERQVFDELLWDQLTAGAATDDVARAERDAGVRHG